MTIVARVLKTIYAFVALLVAETSYSCFFSPLDAWQLEEPSTTPAERQAR